MTERVEAPELTTLTIGVLGGTGPAALLPDSRVTAAFHHVSAVILANLSITHVDLDVLVLGDDRAAPTRYARGPMRSPASAAFTAAACATPARWRRAGIRITGLP